MHSEELLIHDCENVQKPRRISVAFNDNGLGTVCKPHPFTVSPGGSTASANNAARVHGILGKSVAPWSWVQLQFNLHNNGLDLQKYKSIRFYAKGDGGTYTVNLVRKAVSDYSYHHRRFEAGPAWSLIELPLSSFKQTWGKRLPSEFNDVQRIQFSPTAHEESFDLWIDHVVLSTEAIQQKHYDYSDSNWFPYTGIDVNKRRNTALDMSKHLDAPAGKHGWLSCKGEDFVFENGKKIRFWGVNIVASANFPTHEEADKIAECLAQMGVNMTRHHHMDAPWTNKNIFGNNGQTRAFDAEAMDRFDYLIAALQKRGIYQYFDFLVNRKAYEKDDIQNINGLGNGWKIEGIFDPTLIKLQEEFIIKFLKHKNPYTNKTYAEDTACCLMEIINEDSLFYIQKSGGFAIEDDYYKNVLNQQFAKWLQERYISQEQITKAWAPKQPNKQGLLKDEQLANASINSIITFGHSPQNNWSKQRNLDTYAFYYDRTMYYYKRLSKAIRDTGCKAPIAGSNHWTDQPIDLYANAQLDFIDRHSYWAHPQGGWSLDKITHKPEAMVKDRGLGLIYALARRRVLGKPYIITEWQAAAPNDYRVDAQLIMGAMGSFQNWSAIQFAFSHSNENVSVSEVKSLGIFDVINDPNMMAVWHPVSLMMHRQDVSPAISHSGTDISKAKCFDPTYKINIHRKAALNDSIGIRFSDDMAVFADSYSKQREHIVNSTGQLQVDQLHGQFMVNTSQTQAFCGFHYKKMIQLDNAWLKLDNPYACVIISSLDDKAIEHSKHLLITCLGRSINSGMIRDASLNRLKVVGKAPVLIESISGSIKILQQQAATNVQAWCLNHSGQRQQAAKITAKDQDFILQLQSTDRCSFYEIIIK